MRDFFARIGGRRAAVLASVVLALGLVWVVVASADAGNPISGTIKATIIAEDATTITIGVKG